MFDFIRQWRNRVRLEEERARAQHRDAYRRMHEDDWRKVLYMAGDYAELKRLRAGEKSYAQSMLECGNDISDYLATLPHPDYVETTRLGDAKRSFVKVGEEAKHE